MPLISATAGMNTGSAYGARNRTAMCTEMKMTVSTAVGTQNCGVILPSAPASMASA